MMDMEFTCGGKNWTIPVGVGFMVDFDKVNDIDLLPWTAFIPNASGEPKQNLFRLLGYVEEAVDFDKESLEEELQEIRRAAIAEAEFEMALDCL